MSERNEMGVHCPKCGHAWAEEVPIAAEDARASLQRIEAEEDDKRCEEGERAMGLRPMDADAYFGKKLSVYGNAIPAAPARQQGALSEDAAFEEWRNEQKRYATRDVWRAACAWQRDALSRASSPRADSCYVCGQPAMYCASKHHEAPRAEAQAVPVDVHQLLRDAEDQQAERAKQLPTHQDCIRLTVQIRLRLMELGWQSHEYAPKDGTKFEAIIVGFTGPSECVWLGSGFFVADKGDWWPAKPFVWRKLAAAEAPNEGEKDA